MTLPVRRLTAASIALALILQAAGVAAVPLTLARSPKGDLRYPVAKSGTEPIDLKTELKLKKEGKLPRQGGPVRSTLTAGPSASVSGNIQVNNNAGAAGGGGFTQSETSTIAFGNTIVSAFNDSGSIVTGAHFTGWSYSTDGGTTWTDGGALPTATDGDGGDPVLARDATSGRIYLASLPFSLGPTVHVYTSDDDAVTWSAPVDGVPSTGGFWDKPWIAVDNFSGSGQGNVYLIARDFGDGDGIYLFRSTDNGATFGPSGGVAISTSLNQGAYVLVGPDHAVYAFWWEEGALTGALMVRKSTDEGQTFEPEVKVATLANGFDLGLTGVRNGTSSAESHRTNKFPHVAVNPANGDLFAVYNDAGAGADRGDVFLVQSTDGGASWGSPILVNDDGTTTDQWQPTVLASNDGARVGVFYYSRQGDTANNNLFRYYGRLASVSGHALTWFNSFAVSNTDSLPEFGRDSALNDEYMGDYDHGDTTPGLFHVTWSDSRDDLVGGGSRKDPNVYYANINIGFAVESTIPSNGSIVGSSLTDFVVDLTDAVDAASLDAGDLQVNGIPADSVGLSAGDTRATFHFNATPVVAQGLQQMSIAAGAMTRAPDNSPLLAFTGSFRFDVLLMAVVSTVPADGGVFATGNNRNYDVSFNEPYDPASIGSSDLDVTGSAGASVSGYTLLDADSVRYQLDVPNEGTVDVSLDAGAATDVYGNPNTAFAGSYFADQPTLDYPTPLPGKSPAGSLVYDPTAGGMILPAGDSDSFHLALDAGQTVTLVVTPAAGLTPTVTMWDPSSTVIGAATASAAGDPVILQTVPVVTAGTYAFEVGGAAGTTGNFSLQVVLNAYQELEGVEPAAANDSLATAENIDSGFLTLSSTNGTAGRGAVVGRTDKAGYQASAVPYGFTDISTTGAEIADLTGEDEGAANIPIGFSFPFYGTNRTDIWAMNNGVLTFGSSTDEFNNGNLTTKPTQATIAPLWDDLEAFSGGNVYYQLFGSSPSRSLVIQWNDVHYFVDPGPSGPITFEAVLSENGDIAFNYKDLDGGVIGDGGRQATVGIKDAGTQGADRLLLAFNSASNSFVGTGKSTLIELLTGGADYYGMTFNAGDLVTLTATQDGGGTPSLQLRDGTDAVLATGSSGATNVGQVIANFVVPAAGSYYARLTSPIRSDYRLVVTRNAAFDTEDNNTAPTAQAIGGNHGALGAAGDADWYSVTLGAADNALAADTITPGGGPGEPVNTLDPHIELYDSTGTTLIAGGVEGADLRNESLNFGGLAAGATYLLKVTSESGSGDYFVGLKTQSVTLAGPTSQITRSNVTCANESAGTAATLANLTYSIKKNKINQISQGEFIYWVRVSASAGSNSFTINQAINPANFSKKFTLSSGQVLRMDCTPVASPTFTYNGATGGVDVTFTAPFPGSYYVKVVYKTLPLTGQTPPSPTTTIHYDFSTTGVAGSTEGLDVQKK